MNNNRRKKKKKQNSHKMAKNNILLITSFLLLIAVTNQQTISFVSQNQTSQSKCHLEGDDIIFHYLINISSEIDSFDYAKFELQPANTALTTICTLDLHKCNGYKLSNCYCSNTDSKDVFDVTVNITGLPSYSESVLRGKLIFFDRNIYSEGIMLPKLYDRVKPNTKLYINDKIVNLETCEESINGNDVNFFFFLDHKHAHTDHLPCRLEITDGLNNTLKETELVTLSYTAKVYRSQTFILSYEFCGSHKNKGSFVCSIKAELADVSLVINNKDVNIKNCEETVNNSEVNFVFSVEDSERLIKRLALMGDTTGETIETNSFILTHSAGFQGYRIFIFTYELVGLDEKIFYCSIHAGKDKSVEQPMDFCDRCELDGSNVRFIIPMTFSIVLNVIVLLVCNQRKLRKLCEKNQKPGFEKERRTITMEAIFFPYSKCIQRRLRKRAKIQKTDLEMEQRSITEAVVSQNACSYECKTNNNGSEHEGNLSLIDGSSSVVQVEEESDSPIES